VDGWPFHLQNYAFRLYLQHNNKPRYVIQLVGWNILNSREDFYNYEQFLPWANDSLMHAFTKDIDGAFTFAERHVPLFIYNNHFDYLALGIKSYRGKVHPPQNYDRGYVPLMTTWNGDFEKVRAEGPGGFQFYTNDTVVQEFREYLTYCRDNDIKVIFVYAPTYYEAIQLMNNRSDMMKFYASLADAFHIPVLDYSKDSLCYDKAYFSNALHMNHTGAEIFTRKLANDLRAVLQH
jgi:hypothetical protein